jgi:GGDEF domain-containing protein
MIAEAFGPDIDLLSGLSQFGSLRVCEPSEVIFTLGDSGSEMYLIEKGSVDLFFEPGKRPKRLGQGELFGELAFIIGDHQRSATAIVVENQTELRVFGQQALRLLVAHMPQECFRLFRHACAYLVESEKELLDELNQTTRELEYSLDHIIRIRQELTCYRGAGLLDRQTGLLTRHCITMYLEKTYDAHSDDARPVVLALIRIHEQETIRKKLGPKFEAMILPWLVGLLTDIIGPNDLIFREDQHIVGLLLPDSNREQAQTILKALLDAIDTNEFPLADEKIVARVSIGASTYQQDCRPEAFEQGVRRGLDQAVVEESNSIHWI